MCGPRGDEGPPQLGTARLCHEAGKRRDGQVTERSSREGGRARRRAPVSHEGLVPRTVDRRPRNAGCTAAATGREGSENGHRRGASADGTREDEEDKLTESRVRRRGAPAGPPPSEHRSDDYLVTWREIRTKTRGGAVIAGHAPERQNPIEQ